jgi:enterochelin esterase-like enzyme
MYKPTIAGTKSVMRRLKLLVLLVLASPLIACDPLAPVPTPIVIVITPTPISTHIPTAIPRPTATETPIPPIDQSATTDVPLATGDSSAALKTQSSSASVACSDKQGQVVDLSLSSKVVGTDIKYRVYLPPCYNETARRYPYVILMHGSDADQTEWTSTLKADSAADEGVAVQALPPMILVMPDGGDLMNLNAFTPKPSWETIVTDELMPEIEKNFCTWNAREGRAIGGISRGGFWAFEIAFRHPELFSAVGGHSAFFDPDNAPPSYNPMGLAKTIQFAPGAQPRIWLDVGKDDKARPNVEIFERTLAGRNIDPGYTLNPIGDHTVDYWSAHVSEYLSFYGQTWPRDVTALPSCLQ